MISNETIFTIILGVSFSVVIILWVGGSEYRNRINSEDEEEEEEEEEKW